MPKTQDSPFDHDAAVHAELARLEQLANLLDARFRIPGLGVRFGADTLVGLIPGIGDVVTFVPAAYLVWRAYRLGAPLQDVASMGANVAVDTVVGSVPIIGDILDVAFKANRRNVAILQRHLQKRALTEDAAAATAGATWADVSPHLLRSGSTKT